MRMRKLLLLCLLALWVVPIFPQDSPAEREAVPAFYYYNGAFVVESADQTDSRRITPSGHGWSGEYQNWSPSGQWFAWVGTPLYRDSRAVLISSPVLNRPVIEFANASPKGQGDYHLFWAPDDSLLIQSHVTRNLTEEDRYGGMGNPPEDETYEITLVHPSFGYNDSITWDGVGAQWSPQGRYISYYRSPLSTDEDEALLKVMRAADQKSASYTDLYPHDDTDWTPTGDYSPAMERGGPAFSSWTPDEKLVYVNAAGTNLIIQDIETQEQEIFSVPHPNITRIDWNRAGTLALVYAPIEAKPGPLGRQTLWLFARETGDWTKLQDGIEPFQGMISTRPSPWRTGWSPEEHYIVYRDMTQVFVYDVAAKTEVQVPIPGSGELNLFRFSPDLQWMTDESALYIPLTDQLWQYDPLTQEAINTVPPHSRDMGSSMAYDLSPDNTSLAISDSTQGVSVISQSDGQVEAYIPPPSTSHYHDVISIEWDSSGQWLMIDWDAAEQPSFTTFVHRSGFPRHEFSQNQGERRYNWVPSQVAFDGSWGTRILTSGGPDKEFLMVPPDSSWLSYHLNPSAWSPSSERLATLYDHDLVIWNTTTWTQEYTWDLHELAIPDLVQDMQYLDWLDEQYLWIGSRKFGLFDTQTGQIDMATPVDDPTQSSWGAWCARECTEFIVLDSEGQDYGNPILVAKDLLLWQHKQQLMEWLGSERAPTGDIVIHDAQTFSGIIESHRERTFQVFLWEFGTDGTISETDLGVYDMFGARSDRNNPKRSARVQISPSRRYITLSYGISSTEDQPAGASTLLYDRQTKTWSQVAETYKGVRISPQDSYMLYSGTGFYGEDEMGKLTLFNQTETIADGLDRGAVLYWSSDETRFVIDNSRSGISFFRLDKDSHRLIEQTSYSLYGCSNNNAEYPIAFSADQHYLALSNCDTEVAVFDLETFEIVRRVNRVPGFMSWSPDSTWLALDTFQMLSLVHMPQP